MATALAQTAPPVDCSPLSPRQRRLFVHPPAAAAFSDTERGDDTASDPPLMPGGEPYPGDLVGDILEYRALRASTLAGYQLEPDERSRVGILEGILRSDDEPSRGPRNMRAYHRFAVHMAARLRVADGGRYRIIDVDIVDMSAGGVKLELDDLREGGDQVWLLLPRDGSTVAVLPARVAWSGSATSGTPQMGLMFAGAPTCG